MNFPPVGACDLSDPILHIASDPPNTVASGHNVTSQEVFDALDQEDSVTFKALLQQPVVDLLGRNTAGDTPLHHVIRKEGFSNRERAIERVNALVSSPHGKKSEVLNALDREGKTPVMVASTAENSDLIADLAKAGANVNYANEEGVTALMMAVGARSVCAIYALLMAGADYKMTNKQGLTALDMVRLSGESRLKNVFKDTFADLFFDDPLGVQSKQQRMTEVLDLMGWQPSDEWIPGPEFVFEPEYTE